MSNHSGHLPASRAFPAPATQNMKIGNKFRQRIDEAIHLQDKLLLLLSEHSIASTWVENEVEAALEGELDNKLLHDITKSDILESTRQQGETIQLAGAL